MTSNPTAGQAPGAAHPALAGLRCRVRPLQIEDAPLLARLHDDPVRRLMHDRPFDPQIWCDAKALAAFGSMRPWGIELEGRLAGFIALFPGAGLFRCGAEVTYWVARPHWHQGIASEALALVTAWTWTAWPEVMRLYASILAFNPAAQRVAAKCGYVPEAVLPASVLKAGRPAGCVIYGRYRG